MDAIEDPESNAADVRRGGYATTAKYDRRSSMIVIGMNTQIMIQVPAEMVEGLAGGAAKDLSVIEITPSGLGLHWPRLDADLYIPGLLQGLFGTREWMAELGSKGGAVRSAKKAAAARSNGKKGGRPRKIAA